MLAMNEELKSIDKNKTYTNASLPVGNLTVSCMMLLERKVDNNGQIFCYKVRLVANRFFKRDETDYFETFPLLFRSRVCYR